MKKIKYTCFILPIIFALFLSIPVFAEENHVHTSSCYENASLHVHNGSKTQYGTCFTKKYYHTHYGNGFDLVTANKAYAKGYYFENSIMTDPGYCYTRQVTYNGKTGYACNCGIPTDIPCSYGETCILREDVYYDSNGIVATPHCDHMVTKIELIKETKKLYFQGEKLAFRAKVYYADGRIREENVVSNCNTETAGTKTVTVTSFGYMDMEKTKHATQTIEITVVEPSKVVNRLVPLYEKQTVKSEENVNDMAYAQFKDGSIKLVKCRVYLYSTKTPNVKEAHFLYGEYNCQNGFQMLEKYSASSEAQVTILNAGTTANTKEQTTDQTNNKEETGKKVITTKENLKIPVFKFLSSTNEIKFSWNVIPKAENYQVYRYTENEKTKTLLGTTKETIWVDKTAKKGVVYKYQIRAIASGMTNGASKVSKKVYVPVQAKIKKSVVNQSKVKLIWEKQKASGYQVYRSVKKNSGYQKIKTIPSNKNAITLNQKRNTKYFYKVRAFYKINGKIIQGSFSKSYQAK